MALEILTKKLKMKMERTHHYDTLISVTKTIIDIATRF